LYRGFVPTLMGMVPYAGLSFYCFEMLKYFLMKYAPQHSCDKMDRNTGGISSSLDEYALMCSFLGGLVLSIPAKLLCGGFAGAVAQSVSYPLDVTRRRMQLALMSPHTEKFG
jgi:solute carrier family 25 (mitochondrial carrier protein), member 16